VSAPDTPSEAGSGTEPSSYLKYLPPVLWQDEPAAPQFSLGAMLRIFEKILTGIPDDVSAPHDAITAQIARMDRLLGPWTTPGDFLPWLASWVALEFPELQGSQLWDEYQRRKVTAEIARIYRQRGTKAGLGTYLSLYAVGSTRPRVAIDEGIRLLLVDPAAGAVAAVTGLVSQGPAVQGSTVSVPGMARPWCVAVSSDGSLLVGDTAVPAGAPVPLTNCVWHLDQVGRYDLAGAPPRPQPVAAGTLPLTSVVALAVRPAQGPAPETLYVLDRPGRLYAVPAPFPASQAVQVTSLATPGAALWPVAMAVDPGNGDLLVLDRGPQPPEPAAPQVITIQPAPLTVTRTALHTVTEPLSLLAQPDGTLLIGDGGDQAPATAAGFPGNLVRVDRGAAAWTETALLPAGNPLAAPTGITRASDGQLYVLDAGVKPFSPSDNPFICAVAQDAGIFRVDLDAAPAAAQITGPAPFVYPTGLAAAGDRLVVCDPGQPEVAGLQAYSSRVRPFQFDVVIHFADSRLPPDQPGRQLVLSQAVGNISSIIEDQKPAHTKWNLITSIF
jgi:phage tail-like protein